MDLLGYHNNTVELLTNDISLLLLTSMNEGTPIVVSVRLLSTLSLLSALCSLFSALYSFSLLSTLSTLTDVLISSMCSSLRCFKSAMIILT